MKKAPEIDILADRLFNGKSWTISRHRRANGTHFFQLTEMAGARTDWPVMDDEGRVSYDRAVALPQSVKDWTRKTLFRYLNGGPGWP